MSSMPWTNDERFECFLLATDWGGDITYKKQEYVKVGRDLYECRLAHTSGPSFKDDSLIGKAWIWKHHLPY
jgi:hypothetical protein